MIKTLAHVCFTVKDLERSRVFYEEGLGLRLAFDFRNEQGERFGIYLHVGDRTFLELFIGSVADGGQRGSFGHICLEVDDIQETVADLKGRNIEIGEISMGSDHSWQAWLKDPDGNAIELHQYTPESQQVAALR